MFENLFKKSIESSGSSIQPENTDAIMGIDTENAKGNELVPLVTLDGEEMYMTLLSKMEEGNNGIVDKEAIEEAKRIFNLINNSFKDEVLACTKLHSKECGKQLLELYKMIQKN